ncbi:MAG: hypothetical protein IPH84_00260 [Bacteroidales bacterium]|nr:hypothetical protein [Bacteroidales bacterium]
MIKRTVFSLALIASLVFTGFAQTKSFTGTITYKITYPASLSAAMAAALPSSIVMQISSNKAKFEVTLPNGKQTFIVNGDEISVTRLMDLAEGKFYIKKTKEEFQKEDAPSFMPLKESKTIAGYKCKSGEISYKDRGGKVQKSTVYYSDELGSNNIYFNTIAKGVKGILLDFDYSGLGAPMHLTASEITSGRISNKTFEIPTEYKQTTEAELQKLRQANKSR